MNHFPILPSDNPHAILEFSHFNYDAPAGTWKKENVIIRDCVKINVFVEGSFSVFSDGTLHRPIYGDVCFLSPMKMHYGQINESMRVHYYQLDIGRHVFSAIPDGDALIGRLLEATEHKDSFLRPDARSKESVLRFCQEIEDAIRKKELFLAYAKVVEFLCLLYSLYVSSEKVASISYSLRTAQTIRYVEENYAEGITVKEIAQALAVSASFLSRTFKKEIGFTIHEYLNRYRVLKSLEFLKTESVTQTAYLCGFCDSSHFISIFKEHMKITPMQYKKLQL